MAGRKWEEIKITNTKNQKEKKSTCLEPSTEFYLVEY